MHVVYDYRDTKLFLDVILSQPQSPHNTMPKKGKKKSKVVEEDSDLEIMPRIEIIYEDTKVITRAEPKFKWGQIYPMIIDQKVLDVGLEYIPIYENILRSGITNVSTRWELFPCAKVIGWILTKADINDMIIYNIKGKNFSSFTPAYLSKACNLPVQEIIMTND